ncbi:MAG: efflux RND transporter permease subunit [Phycisphaeraceae bacterium]
MDIIRFAITNPVKVAVGVLLTILFGLIALLTIPIQLTPNVDQPKLTIETTWIGRSPQEIETEILQEQEDKLKSVSNLKKMVATANTGVGTIEMEFYVGTDMNRARQEVSDKLREVPDYPDDVDEPVINSGQTDPDQAIAWLLIKSDEPGFDIQTIGEQVKDRVKPFLETIEGVTEVQVYGGRDREVHIRIDPREMAQRGITFNMLRNAIQGENINVSAGDLPEGRLDVRVRTVGQYDDIEQILETVVTDTDAGPVRVRDLGDAVETYEKRRSFVRSMGENSLALPVYRETGSNVIEVMQKLRERVRLVNEQILPTIGPKLRMEQVYDETTYINQAINLVQNNLWMGGSLAGLALLVFLRTIRPTLVVALSIPISVIGTFVVMTLLGRNLNVISLAGLAFAVGMVVDAAIVVLENIDRHLSMDKPVRQAAYDAAKEVWGAILSSTLTTVAVFVPVIFLEEEAGQLFRDIAIAICAAVLLSLVVSITVIPSASARFLRRHDAAHDEGPIKSKLRGLFGLTSVLSRFTNSYTSWMYRMVQPGVGSALLRVVIVAGITLLSLGAAYLLMPPTSYLPSGNKNLVFGIMLTPPGYNIEQNSRIGDHMEQRLRPYWEAKTYDDLKNAPPVIHPFSGMPVPNVPPIGNFFFVSYQGSVFYGAISRDDRNVKPMESLLMWAGSGVPASIGLAFQQGLFGRDMLGGNSIDIEIVGQDLDRIREDALVLRNDLMGAFGPFAVQPSPMNFDKAGREAQVRVDYVKASALGIRGGDLGFAVQGLVDGLTVGDYRLAGDNVDLKLVRHPDLPLETDTLSMIPVAYHDRDGRAGIVPLSHVAEVVQTQSPQQIRRINYQRAVTLSLAAPPGMPLEALSTDVESRIDRLRAEGMLSDQTTISLAGTADKLTQVRHALLGEWHGWSLDSVTGLLTSRMFLALLVTYLLMAALFESFLYPFVIMFSVPLATVGGFLGLSVVHQFNPDQQLDTLTMLGFVILIGVVVNNAILIVHQALNFMRGLGEGEGDTIGKLPPREALRESVRSRIRPIFMTTTTSVFGMLPLVLMPGSGSELYRGLGSVVVGGLIVSTLFTLLVVPLLFSLVMELRERVMGRVEME